MPDSANQTVVSVVPQRILIAEDVEDTRTTLQDLLKLSLGLEVDTAEDGQKALQMLEEKPYSLLITDLRMPKLSGMKLIEAIIQRRLPVTVIVTTGHGGVPEAVKAMQMGAYDFFIKPPEPEHLVLVIQRALRERSLQDEVAALRQELLGRHSFQNVLSRSPRMIEIFELISQVAHTQSTVLILGETGTGKEQIARAIHQGSTRKDAPFIAVNCGALNENLLESELFGHEKGSFTGAAGTRKGRFEVANGGTLFLDEIGDVPMSMQVRLLRVLQERRFERVGGTESVEVDVRVIAATHRNVDQMIKTGAFRDDLYYRLNVIRIELPPLRERPEDIRLLAAHFCQRFARPGHPPASVSDEAMEILLKCPWPGNVRQLENAIEHGCVTAREDVILPKNLPLDVARTGGIKHPFNVDLTRPLPDQLAGLTAAFEERYLRRALKRTRGHVGKCATISGLSRRSVTDKIAQYQIDKTSFKTDAE